MSEYNPYAIEVPDFGGNYVKAFQDANAVKLQQAQIQNINQNIANDQVVAADRAKKMGQEALQSEQQQFKSTFDVFNSLMNKAYEKGDVESFNKIRDVASQDELINKYVPQLKNIEIVSDPSTGKNVLKGTAYDPNTGEEVQYVIDPKTGEKKNFKTGLVGSASLSDRAVNVSVQSAAGKQEAVGGIKIRQELGQDFNTRPIVKSNKEKIAAAVDVRALLNEKNPIADEISKNRLVKLSGDSGNIAISEKSDVGGSKALQARVKQAYENMRSGLFTEDNRKAMVELSNVLEKEAKKRLTSEADTFADVQSRATNMDKKDLLYILEPEIYGAGSNSGLEKPASSGLKKSIKSKFDALRGK